MFTRPARCVHCDRSVCEIRKIKAISLFADPSSRSNATAASVIRLAVELNSEDGRYASRREFSDTRGSPSPWM